MTFLAPLALLVGLLAITPVIAHALRRGKAEPQPFPAARLVTQLQATARSQSSLQDRALLSLRLLLIACLAVLGASPFVSCSRLALSRDAGASMAIAMVIDDSASMRVTTDSKTRFQDAVEGARQLLQSARPGDAFSIVLAGHPARVVTPATTDLSSALTTLSSLSVSDRPTDLEAALRLAQGTISGLPQADRQVVVLSDFATEAPLELEEEVSTPLEKLRAPFENCAIAKAQLEGHRVAAELGCTSAAAARGRQVELVTGDGEVISTQPLEDTVSLSAEGLSRSTKASVRLSPGEEDFLDQIPEDDEAPVLQANTKLLVGLRADAARSGLRTGGSTILKAALDSLDAAAKLEPLALLPESSTELEPFSALIIDDPPGFTPEAAEALEEFARAGGVVMGFLGPRVRNAPLGSDFRPLIDGAATWSTSRVSGIDPQAETGLGPLTIGWADIEPTGHVQVGEQPDARVLARLQGGAPLLLERPRGRGLLIASLLPSSVDVSDFALRPAFLALLEHVLHEAAIRHGTAATTCGSNWEIPQGTTVTGPQGPVEPTARKGTFTVQPNIAGRYVLQHAGQTSIRHAIVDLDENLLQPRELNTTGQVEAASSSQQRVDISREIALVILVLGILELALRAVTRNSMGLWRRRSAA